MSHDFVLVVEGRPNIFDGFFLNNSNEDYRELIRGLDPQFSVQGLRNAVKKAQNFQAEYGYRFVFYSSKGGMK